MFVLYPHNQQAYDNAQFVFENQNRTCIVHATGTGKSLIVAKFIWDNLGCKFLFIAPNVFIHSELKKHIRGQVHNVDFLTYQHFIFNKAINYTGYDYIFLDEFHRAGATEWSVQIKELLALNRQAKILGTSATHVRYLDDERNMAEEIFEGNISSHLDLGTAIEKGIHKKPVYVSALYNIRKILDESENALRQSSKKNNHKKADLLKSKRVVWEQSSGIDFILRKYLTADRKKIIIFCKTLEHIEYVRELVEPVLSELYNNDIKFDTVFSKFGQKNQRTFNNFEKSKIPQVLYVVDMLNEGIHVKGVDTVMMFRDTVSPIIYFQQMGRCFTVGQQQQPLVFDFVNNINIRNSAQQLVQNFYENFSEGTSFNNQFFKKRDLLVDFYDETIDFANFIQDFTLTKTFDENVGAVILFIDKNGRLPNDRENKWLRTQKTQYNKGELSQERIQKLLDIDPNIFERKRKQLLEIENLQKLIDFVNENGRLPNDKENKWLRKQKTIYNKGELSQELIQKLLDIDPNIFEKKLLLEEENLQKLIDFVNENGRFPNIKENRWLHSKKSEYRKGKLSQELIDKLLDLDENIFERKVLSEDENIQKLIDFVNENGRLPNSKENKWLWAQKNKFNKGELSQELIQKLLNIDTNIFEKKYLAEKGRLQKLIDFVNTNGRLPNSRENLWLSTQKRKYNKGTLSQELIIKLLDIDENIFERKVFSEDENLQKLIDFVNENGRLPNSKENKWLPDQKVQYNKGHISQELIQKLLDIDPNIFESRRKRKPK